MGRCGQREQHHKSRRGDDPGYEGLGNHSHGHGQAPMS
jgi:hypothetical protein